MSAVRLGPVTQLTSPEGSAAVRARASAMVKAARWAGMIIIWRRGHKDKRKAWWERLPRSTEPVSGTAPRPTVTAVMSRSGAGETVSEIKEICGEKSAGKCVGGGLQPGVVLQEQGIVGEAGEGAGKPGGTLSPQQESGGFG